MIAPTPLFSPLYQIARVLCSQRFIVLYSRLACLAQTSFAAMPEIRECQIHFKHVHHVLVETLGLGRNKDHDWALQDLFADATDEEAGIKKSSKLRAGLTDRHAGGFLDRLNISCTLMRGQKAHQTRIWPGTDESPERLDGLVLCGLSYTPRSLILEFGRLELQVWCHLHLHEYNHCNHWWQISWLTHSSPQLFTPAKWQKFLLVHKKNRAKVALALKFGDVVLAVLSLDLLVQVILHDVSPNTF